MRKRHLRMNQERLTKKILIHFERIKVVSRWFDETYIDMKKMGFREKDIQEGETVSVD